MSVGSPTPLHITLVGCGSMGHAMLSAWTNRFDPTAHFTVITPHQESLKDLKHTNRLHWQDPETVIPFKTDLIFFAVKPDTLGKVLKSYVEFKPTAYLSIAAGKTISYYREILSPHIPFIRLMPNTPIAVGEGMTALFTSDPLNSALKKQIEVLVQAFGKFIWLKEEEQFHPVTALSGSGPAYVFYLAEMLEQAGINMGLSQELAYLLARQTVIGAGKYLGENPDLSSQLLRQQVTSKGGTTEAAFNVLTKDSQFQNQLTHALQMANDRSKEL